MKRKKKRHKEDSFFPLSFNLSNFFLSIVFVCGKKKEQRLKSCTYAVLYKRERIEMIYIGDERNEKKSATFFLRSIQATSRLAEK